MKVSTILVIFILGIFLIPWSMQAVPSCHIDEFGCIKSIKTLLTLPLLLILAFAMTAIRPQLEPFLFLFIESTLTCCYFLFFSFLLFWLISLCFSHSLFVNCLPLWPVCVRAEWALFSAGRPSWITQASCLAWIGIWFHLSLISGPPYSAHFVSYHDSF